MSSLLTDLRFALASIARRPLVATAVIVTLGLGIGANAALFRAFNAAFLRPLPFANEDQLVRVVLTSPRSDARLSPRPDVFFALRDHSRSFSGLAAQRFNDLTLLEGGEPQPIRGIEVSEGWARTLGIRPQIGRTFTRDEEQKGGGAGVAIISDAAWRTRFGATPEILGQPIALDRGTFSVVGVLPPGLRFPYEADVWLPARFDLQVEAPWALNIVGRLRDGVTVAAASNELRALSGRLPEVKAQPGMHLHPMPLRETLVDDQQPMLIAVSAAAAFLLLLVTVNVANLLAAHSLSRQREFAIRTALGAGFARHLQQTMTEGLVLAIAGGALGLAVAWGSTSLLQTIVPENFAFVFDSVPFDARVVLFSIALVVLTGCVFGAIPALRIARRDPQEFLAGGGRTTERRPATIRAMIATTAQLALALMLLAGALAMIGDVQRRLALDLGYDARNLLTASVVLPQQRYAGADERDRFFDQLTAALGAIPGVEAAGTVNLFPAAGQGALFARIEGEGVEYRADAPLLAHNRMVHGRLLETLRLRIVRGRLMSADELRRGDAVAVISRALATTLWPSADPIGKRVRDRRRTDEAWLQVVGVVEDLEEFYGDTTRAIWQPVKVNTENAATAQAVIVLRSPLAPDALAQELRASVRKLDPQLAVFEASTAASLYRNSLAGRESARTLTVAFAMLGLIVAAIGVYAAMAFAMMRRTRELAVRLALGATPRTLTRQFLGRVAVMIVIGSLAGIAATTWLARLGRSLAGDFTITAAPVLTAAAILAAVALLASWLPLRRALRIEPVAVLRSE